MILSQQEDEMFNSIERILWNYTFNWPGEDEQGYQSLLTCKRLFDSDTKVTLEQYRNRVKANMYQPGIDAFASAQAREIIKLCREHGVAQPIN